jgi:hypothetical protein
MWLVELTKEIRVSLRVSLDLSQRGMYESEAVILKDLITSREAKVVEVSINILL